MTSHRQRTADIIEKTRSFSGVTAGIVELREVLKGPSYQGSSVKNVITSPSNDTDTGARWVLVLGLYHPSTTPELDWWQEGNTPGNRRLMEITALMEQWLDETLDLRAQSLPYDVKKGSLFQKDAAVLSGIGIVGRNNLLLHPDWGPRIRFRSMLVSGDLVPTPPLEDFDPCATCSRPCQNACPQEAFARGIYIRDRCRRQMEADVARAVPGPHPDETGGAAQIVKYCRECELTCPIGRNSTGD